MIPARIRSSNADVGAMSSMVSTGHLPGVAAARPAVSSLPPGCPRGVGHRSPGTFRPSLPLGAEARPGGEVGAVGRLRPPRHDPVPVPVPGQASLRRWVRRVARAYSGQNPLAPVATMIAANTSATTPSTVPTPTATASHTASGATTTARTHRSRQRDAALEAAVGPLPPVVAALVLVGRLPALAADAQHTVLDAHLHVLVRVDPWQLHAHHQVPVPGEHVACRRPPVFARRQGGGGHARLIHSNATYLPRGLPTEFRGRFRARPDRRSARQDNARPRLRRLPVAPRRSRHRRPSTRTPEYVDVAVFGVASEPG